MLQSVRAPKQRVKISRVLAKEFDVILPLESQNTISPNEAAAMLGITGEAVKQWVYHGRLPAVKLQNGYWRIKVKDLSKYLESKMGLKKRIILIAPTDAPTLDWLIKVIEDLGHIALVANNEIDAVLKARNQKPSLMLLDLSNSSSWSLLRKRDSQIAQKVLLLLGRELTTEQMQVVADSGAVAALQKPIDEDVFRRELVRAIDC